MLGGLSKLEWQLAFGSRPGRPVDSERLHEFARLVANGFARHEQLNRLAVVIPLAATKRERVPAWPLRRSITGQVVVGPAS